MNLPAVVRHTVVLCLVALLGLSLSACGGGGGGGGANNGGGGEPTASTPTRLPTVNPPTPHGTVPTTTPSATPSQTPSQTPTDTSTPSVTPTSTPTALQPGGSILDALKSASPGSTIVVSPGIYESFALKPGDLQGPVTLLADVSGLHSAGPPGQVTIQVRGNEPAILLTEQSDVTIDGFTLRGVSTNPSVNAAGVRAVRSARITVRNCIVKLSGGEGLRFEQSADALIFNNLIWNNTDAGIGVVASNNVRIIDNTVYANKPGLDIEGSSTNVSVSNNIFDKNTSAGIMIGASVSGYEADYNLNTDGYGSGTPVGDHDIRADPRFTSPGADDTGFHLLAPDDECAGGSPAIDAGDPQTALDLLAALQQGTTQTSGVLDCIGAGCCVTANGTEVRPGEIDLGYHYPGPQVFATPTLQPTSTRTPKPGKTPTPTHQAGTPQATPTPTSGTPGPSPTAGTPGPTLTFTSGTPPTATATPTPTSKIPTRVPTKTPKPTFTPR